MKAIIAFYNRSVQRLYFKDFILIVWDFVLSPCKVIVWIWVSMEHSQVAILEKQLNMLYSCFALL